jgi:hypothetical protein
MTRPSAGFVRRLLRPHGQSLAEFAMMLPIVIVVVLGVAEVGYALLDLHVVTKLAREGSNLISRNTSLQDAVNALKSMSQAPVNFNDGSSKVIFSVIMEIGATGAPNYGEAVLYQRHEYGSLPATSALQTAGAGSFGPAPEYQALNPNSDPNLQVTNLPANLNMAPGGMVYVTEIFTRHNLITPFDRFGIQVPQTLYSIAYF